MIWKTWEIRMELIMMKKQKGQDLRDWSDKKVFMRLKQVKKDNTS